MGFSRLFGGIGQLMTPVRYFFPKNVHGGFQMLMGFVQQVNVGGILDVRRGCCGIHDELPAIFLLLLFPFQLLLEGILVSFAAFGWLLLFFLSGRLLILVLLRVIRRVVAVNIPLLLRPLTGADVLVDFRHFLYRKTLAKVYHHGSVK